MDYKQDKSLRILDIYIRLCEGKVINKSEEADRFHVDERSIQRDIDSIRKYLQEREFSVPGEVRSVTYSREKKGFEMIGDKKPLMSNSEILAVSEILLESRAFTKIELEEILDKLISGCVPQKNMKLVSELIANEKFHYVELRNSSAIQDKLWEIGTRIKDQKLLEIQYQKGGDQRKVVSSIIQPLAIIFSEYYFYLIGNIVKKNEKGRYETIFEYPAIYRIDRILDFKELPEKFEIEYGNRFEEGEFRKRIQFMFQGKLMKLQFKYYGTNLEAIFDRLPTARLRSDENGVKLIEAEVFGMGITMWLLGMGNMVEVVRPLSLREEMKAKIEEMQKRYLKD